MRLFSWLLLLLLLANGARAVEMNGVWTMQGERGPIVLTLQGDAEGISGTLRGGSLNLTLKGFQAEGNSFPGVATTEDGAFASYFSVTREGGHIHFDIIEPDEEGEPDPDSRVRLTFGAGAGAGSADNTAGHGAGAPRRASSLARARHAAQARQPVKTRAAKPASRPSASKPAGKPAPTRSHRAPAKAAPRPARAASNANAGRQPSGGPAAGGANWQSFHHASGLAMRYPASWKLQRQEGFAFLVPPDQGKDASGPLEAYIVAGQGSEGVASIDDPRVVPYLEEQMAGFAPFLQREGEPRRIQAATTPGIVVSWSGTNPQGKRINAQVYATIVKNYSMSLITLGEPARLKKRENTVRSIFASFAAGAGKRDSRIAGSWKFYSFKSSADGKFGTERTRYMRLAPDGRASWSSRSESSGSFAGRDADGNTTWTGGVAGQGGNSDSGAWSAENGELFILWNDGSTSSWDYRVHGATGGRRLFLKGANAQADEWTETR